MNLNTTLIAFRFNVLQSIGFRQDPQLQIRENFVGSASGCSEPGRPRPRRLRLSARARRAPLSRKRKRGGAFCGAPFAYSSSPCDSFTATTAGRRSSSRTSAASNATTSSRTCRSWRRSSRSNRRRATCGRPRPPEAGGRLYRLCENYSEKNVCNWAVPADQPEPLCLSCQLTETIPDLGVPGHLEAWYALEVAKRRLIYSLMALKLPLAPKSEDADEGLAFRFLADPAEPSEEDPPILTGHACGVITVNLAEADDAEREKRRLGMHEPYRTLLGHFRHEVGHYYWDRLIRGQRLDRRIPPALRRRSRGLRRSSQAALRPGTGGRLARTVRLGLRQFARLGGLGGDVGPLPPHN